MNKKKHTPSKEEMQVLKRVIREAKKYVVQELEKAQVIRRKRKLTSVTLLLEALYHYLTDEQSLWKVSIYMLYEHGVQLSKVAWQKQFNKTIPVLYTIAKEYLSSLTVKECKKVSIPVFCLDATSFTAENYNGTPCRVHTMLTECDGIVRYTHVSDDHQAESVKHFPIQSGALYLADRAYAKRSQIVHMLQHKADFVFRMSPAHIQLYLDAQCTKRLKVDELLKGETISQCCYIKRDGQKRGYRIRLVGLHLPAQEREEAEKQVKEHAQKNGSKIRPSTILYSHWLLLLTSLSQAHTTRLCKLYRRRWQIECFFRRAKMCLRQHCFHKGSQHFSSS